MSNISLEYKLTPKVIGIIGGGQLGRMMAIAARHMGFEVAVLDPTKNCPAAQVADMHIEAAYDDAFAIDKLIEVSDVITYEFENVDLKSAKKIEIFDKLPQGAYALEVTQNRQKEKELMRQLGLPVPNFAIVESGAECEAALKDFPLPAVIKTCRGGYDGKGQVKMNTEADYQEAIELAEASSPCIIEEWIPFDKEISVVFTRSLSGEIEFFPIAENEHRDQILFKTTVPASINPIVEEKALEATKTLAKEMGIVGTFAVEMFVSGDDIYINEMAPRPHNSGHYTIEACNVSQFTQHIRAICGYPLVPVKLLTPAVMINVLGEDMDRMTRAIPFMKYGFAHLYGKDTVKSKRKMGHVTFIGDEKELKEAVTDYLAD